MPTPTRAATMRSGCWWRHRSYSGCSPRTTEWMNRTGRSTGPACCIACHRRVMTKWWGPKRRARGAVVRCWLGEPTFCEGCGRPRDVKTAVFQNSGWLSVLVALRKLQEEGDMKIVDAVIAIILGAMTALALGGCAHSL